MTAPGLLRVRAYNVGFGDCILLSFGYPDGTTRHALVDFGSTKLPANGVSLTQVADHIRAEIDGQLAVVAATHRHADHISGFAGDSEHRGAATLDGEPWTDARRDGARRRARRRARWRPPWPGSTRCTPTPPRRWRSTSAGWPPVTGPTCWRRWGSSVRST